MYVLIMREQQNNKETQTVLLSNRLLFINIKEDGPWTPTLSAPLPSAEVRKAQSGAIVMKQ